jgi:hypothetical protein
LAVVLTCEQGLVPAESGDRKSLPSLLMVSRDLTKVLNDRYPGETQTQGHLGQLTSLATPANTTFALRYPPHGGPSAGRDAPALGYRPFVPASLHSW